MVYSSRKQAHPRRNGYSIGRVRVDRRAWLVKNSAGSTERSGALTRVPCVQGVLKPPLLTVFAYRRVEQWSARQPHKLEVGGSSPPPATLGAIPPAFDWVYGTPYAGVFTPWPN